LDGNETVVVEKEGRKLAILKPIGSAKTGRRKEATIVPSPAEAVRSKEGILKAAGRWKEIVDAEAFNAYIYERRRTSSRPPVRL